MFSSLSEQDRRWRSSQFTPNSDAECITASSFEDECSDYFCKACREVRGGVGDEDGLCRRPRQTGYVRRCSAAETTCWKMDGEYRDAHRKPGPKNENASLGQFHFPPRYAHPGPHLSAWRS